MSTITPAPASLPPTLPRSRAGMTLVEVIIAMAILVVGIGAVFDSMATSKMVNERAANMALAYQEIQAQIEKIQMIPFVDLVQDTSGNTGFKGIGFTVPGLNAAPGNPCTGVVVKASNPNPWDTTVGVGNPNLFPTGSTLLSLRFLVQWVDSQGQCSADVLYTLCFRGI